MVFFLIQIMTSKMKNRCHLPDRGILYKQMNLREQAGKSLALRLKNADQMVQIREINNVVKSVQMANIIVTLVNNHIR